MENLDLRLKLNVDRATRLCHWQFAKGDEAIFQFSMNLEEFEQLSSDMIRVIKDVNLADIKDYEERKAKGIANGTLVDWGPPPTEGTVMEFTKYPDNTAQGVQQEPPQANSEGQV
jgi:hypothetical protein